MKVLNKYYDEAWSNQSLWNGRNIFPCSEPNGNLPHRHVWVQLKTTRLWTTNYELVPELAKTDFDQISANLSTIDWAKELEVKSGIDSWEYVKEVIDRETDRCVPKKRRRTGSRPLWMTRNIMMVHNQWLQQEKLRGISSFQEDPKAGKEGSQDC